MPKRKLTGLFTSDSAEWETPQDLFDKLHEEFHFELDPCATHDNAKCDLYITKSTDGLKTEWTGNVFMNPPYGREIGKWVEKAYLESRRGCLVVCLLPARTDTAWWHDFVMKADEIRYIRGRLKFSGSKTGAPFPSAIVIFRKNNSKLHTISLKALLAMNDKSEHKKQ